MTREFKFETLHFMQMKRRTKNAQSYHATTFLVTVL